MGNKEIFLSLIIAVFLIGFSQIISASEDLERNEFSGFIKVIREQGIDIPEQAEYSKLVETLRSIQISVPKSYNESVLKYLRTENASRLIRIPTSKPGWLKWNFHDVIYLKKDLIFVKYNDGEMFGGDVLLRIIADEDQISNINILWNDH